MLNPRPFVAVLSLFFLYSGTAVALPAPVSLGFYGSLAAKGGYGKSFSEDTTSVPSRTMLVPALEAVFGFHYGHFILGACAEYAWWQQQTKPANVGGSNTQGTMTTITPVAGLRAGPLRLLARYFPLYDKYAFAKKTSAGSSQEYFDADQLGVQLHFQGAGRSFLGFEYANTKFKSRRVGGVESVLASGAQLNFTTLGVMYGFRY